MSDALMPFVESTFAAAVQRLRRADKMLDRTGQALTPEEMGRLHAHILIALDHIASGMRLLDLPAPERDHTPTLRLVSK